MNQLIDEIKTWLPSHLKQFTTADDISPEKWNTGPSFNTCSIACSNCGSGIFRLRSHVTRRTKGWFRKQTVTEVSSPIYLNCSDCSAEYLLFNSELHGWIAQDPDRDKPDVKLTRPPSTEVCGSFLITFSYQGVENYEDIIEEGCQNPEDFFDTFTIYIRDNTDQEYAQLCTFECA